MYVIEERNVNRMEWNEKSTAPCAFNAFFLKVGEQRLFAFTLLQAYTTAEAYPLSQGYFKQMNTRRIASLHSI